MLDYLEKLAGRKSFDYADARIEKTGYFSISIENGELNVDENSYHGIGVRILNKGSWGFASINIINKKSAEKAFNEAYRLSKIRLKEKNAMQRYKKQKFKEKPSVGVEDIDYWAGKLKKLESGIKHKNIKNTLISIICKNTAKTFWNSEGTAVEQNDTFSYNISRAVSQKNGVIQNWMERNGVLGGLDKLISLEKTCLKTKRKALALLDAKPCPKGIRTVVMDPDLVGVFCHEAVGHASEADIVNAGGSILGKMVGEKVGIPEVNIVDAPKINCGFGNIKYDDEGVKTKKVEIIKKGVLKGYLHSRETAKEYNIEPTGNARATSYNFTPIVRMRNTLMMPCGHSKEEVFGIKDGIYLKGMRGGQVEPLNGIFMFAAKEGFVIKNGEICEQLRDISLNSDILTTLHNIEAIGKDFDPKGVGFCGKGGQSIRTGDGGPHIRVKNMRLG